MFWKIELTKSNFVAEMESKSSYGKFKRSFSFVF